MKHLVAMAEQKGCHGNYNGNGATTTLRVIRQLIEMSVQEKMWMNGSCEDGGVIPDTGFPMGRRHGNRGGTTNVHGRKQQLNMHLIHTCFRPRVIVSAVIPSKRAIVMVRVR